ncbi:hypothetical protein MBLNU230_g2043t1 [Neophaeotheca triangularis]
MSSLFGGGAGNTNNHNASGGGSSLFGGGNAAPASSGGGAGSLFGGAAQKPASGGGLFGGGGSGATGGGAQGGASSLFGGAAAGGQQNNTTQGGTGSGLFGGGGAGAQNSNTQVGSSGSSLFGGGGAGAQNNNAQGGSGSSLFGGGLGAQKDTAQGDQGGNASKGGFGASLGGPATGGQNTTNTQQAGGSSLFGGAANNNTQQAGQDNKFLNKDSGPNNSLFGSSLLASSKPENAPQNPNGPSPQPAYFDHLLERGKKRQNEERNGAFGELPQLQLGLADISRKVRNLGQGGPTAGLARAGDAKAHYLLSASGVNTSHALKDLEDLAGQGISGASAAQSRFETADDVYQSSVKDFLAKRYQDQFQASIDRTIQKSKDDFNRMVEDAMPGYDRDAQMQRIYEHFGLKKPREDAGLDQSAAGTGSMRETGGFGRTAKRSRAHGASSIGRSLGPSNMTRSVIGVPGPKGARMSAFGDVADKVPMDGVKTAPEDRLMRTKQDKYSDRVRELNVARMQEKVCPVLLNFSQVEAQPSNEDTSMLVNAYKAIKQITGEDESKDSLADPGAIKERQYASDYLDESNAAEGQRRIRKRIIDGSRTFLEKLYFEQLEATVSRNPREANVGGVPTALAKVRGYVRVRAARKELVPSGDLDVLQQVSQDYCWAVIFYLLRCGLMQEALEYVEANAQAFRQIDRSFTRYLQTYASSPDRKLPNELSRSINNEYSQRQRLAPEDSIDPYRMMCYKIIGRCDLPRRGLEGLHTDMMDWIWLQFTLARESNKADDMAHEAFGLEEIKQTVREIGERYFGPGSEIPNAPTTYFFMQILAGLFEKAVADLYATNYVSAAHFAIALSYYGLLRVSHSDNSDDLMSYTTRQQPQIAFANVLGLYTRDFRTSNPTTAVDYLALICLNKDLPGELGKNQRQLCHQALQELVLETREFAQLLGDIRGDGQRIKGAVENRLKLIGLENEQEFLKIITLSAARTAEDQNRTTDAALLFHLAEDYDKVIQVINEAVSLALNLDIGEQPMRIEPLKPRSDAQQQTQNQPEGSLSMTAVDDPIDLARKMRAVYEGNNMYYSKIAQRNMSACTILLQLASARQALENQHWASALEHIAHSKILPLQASGSVSQIRQQAQAFDNMPTPVSRVVGQVMLWSVIAAAQNVEVLSSQQFETGQRQRTIEQNVQAARDVMVFAGLIRYKLPGRVWERIARAGEGVGGV